MFRLRSTYPIGLDIGYRHICASQLKQRRTGLSIRDLWYRELNGPAETDSEVNEELVSLLKEMSRDAKFRGRRVVVHLPFRNLFSFPLRFQVGPGEFLEEAIVREAKKYVPFPLEGAVIDYPAITSPPSDSPNQYSATIIAGRRDFTKQYIELLKQAGLIVEAIDFDVCSLIRLHHFLYDTRHDPVIICNLGYSESLLSIVTEDNILAQRHIPWGTKALLEKLTANLEHVDEEIKGKKLLQKYGLLYEARDNGDKGLEPLQDTEMNNVLRTIYQIIAPSIEELIHEFHKIIAYVRSEVPNPAFEAIYLYGHGSLIYNLDRYVEKRLQIPTKLVNPFTSSVLGAEGFLRDTSEGGAFTLALGLAMRKVTWL